MPDYPSNFVYSSQSGTTSTLPFITHFDVRDPNIYDVNYSVQTRWVNVPDETEWILRGFTSTTGVVFADWLLIGSSVTGVETLTGNTGGPVGLDNNHNINVVGDGTTATVVGTPLNNTLTITALFTETTYVENSGTATPSAGTLNVLGTNGITTSGSGNTIDITTAGNIALTYVEDSGSAVAVGQILNIKGGTGIATSGAGNTITITSISPNINQIVRQVFTSSGTYTPTVGMQYCDIEMYGGGGGSGGTAGTGASQGAAAGGGGQGEYAVGLFSAAAIGASQGVVIGAGGVGAVAGNNPGGAGGNTSVGALISAFGGGGGQGSPAYSPPAGGSSDGGLGGTGGSGGDYRIAGQAGGASINANGGSDNSAGFGGGMGGGAGGQWTPPKAATGYGGGAGGPAQGMNTAAQKGAAGFAGVIIITEYVAI
jgi:hypothetical protein